MTHRQGWLLCLVLLILCSSAPGPSFCKEDRGQSDAFTQLYPRDPIAVLKAAERIREEAVKNPAIRIPALTLLLVNGNQLTGTLLRGDFRSGKITFLIPANRFSSHVAFLDSKTIIGVIVNDIHLCPEFAKILEGI